MTEIPLYLFPLLFLVALLYASVGHGGASGYLALMGIAGISLIYARPVALTLNCLVSLIAFLQFFRRGHFDFKLLTFLVISSVPFAFIGAQVELSELLYKKILGVFLILVAIRLFFPLKEIKFKVQYPVFVLLITGACIGFVSGLIGIGGGIILTPLLILSGWSNMKTAATVSALFIFANSASGLAAQFTKGIEFDTPMYMMLAVAASGGLIGSYFGATHWNSTLLQKILSVVLIIASIKLIFL